MGSEAPLTGGVQSPPPFPEGHGFQHRASAVCLCGVIVLECPAMIAWSEQRQAQSARVPSRRVRSPLEVLTYDLRWQGVANRERYAQDVLDVLASAGYSVVPAESTPASGAE